MASGSSKGSDPRGPNGRHVPAVVLTRDITGALSGQGVDGSSGGAQNGALGPVVNRALQDVLGWKINADDSKGFVNALNRSFELTDYEGHVQSKWIQRGIAVQDDLAGGIAGAQASLYSMAKTVLDQTLPLLSGLRPLKPDADEEYITVIRQLVQNQLTELVSELGFAGGPRVVRVNQYFHMLTGVQIDAREPGERSEISGGPDHVHGTLGAMRDEMGLRAVAVEHRPSYINSVEDEQNVTNFRVIVDYVSAIFNSWTNSARFFSSFKSPFLGTQLVWISRQLGVVSEAVEEIRFLLDSDLVGPAERETMWLHGLHFQRSGKTDVMLPDITLESLLSWIQTFVRNEAPDIIRNGGKYAIGVDLERMVRQLHQYAAALVRYAEAANHDHRLDNERVLPALRKLSQQLHELGEMAHSVGTKHLPDRTGPHRPDHDPRRPGPASA